MCSLAEFCDVLLFRAEHSLTPYATRIIAGPAGGALFLFMSPTSSELGCKCLEGKDRLIAPRTSPRHQLKLLSRKVEQHAEPVPQTVADSVEVSDHSANRHFSNFHFSWASGDGNSTSRGCSYFSSMRKVLDRAHIPRRTSSCPTPRQTIPTASTHLSTRS